MSVIINGNNTPVAGGVAVGTSSGELAFTAAGTSGQYLISNGAGVEPTWQTGSGGALPGQGGHAGEFLTTDGSTAAWAAVDALPSQSGHAGEFLTTDGTTASWAPAGGGGGSSFTSTAYKAISQGAAVVVNQDGTVSQVTPTTYGNSGTFQAITGTQYFGPFSPVYDPVNNQFFAIWSDYSVPTNLWYQAFTTSDTTLTPVGSPSVLWASTANGSLSYNSPSSIIIGNKLYTFFAFYGSGNPPKLVVSTISAGGVLTYDTSVDVMIPYYNNSTPTSISMEYDQTNLQLVILANFGYSPSGYPTPMAIETYNLPGTPILAGGLDIASTFSGSYPAGENIQIARLMIYQGTGRAIVLGVTNGGTRTMISWTGVLSGDTSVYVAGTNVQNTDTSYAINSISSFSATLAGTVGTSPYKRGRILFSYTNNTVGPTNTVLVGMINVYTLEGNTPFMAWQSPNTTYTGNAIDTSGSGFVIAGPSINPTYNLYITDNGPGGSQQIRAINVVFDTTFVEPSGIYVNSSFASSDQGTTVFYAYDRTNNSLLLETGVTSGPNQFYIQCGAVVPGINSNLYKPANASSNLVGISPANYASGAPITVQTIGAVNSNQTGVVGGTTYFANTSSFPPGTIQPTGNIPIGVGINSTSILITL